MLGALAQTVLACSSSADKGFGSAALPSISSVLPLILLQIWDFHVTRRELRILELAARGTRQENSKPLAICRLAPSLQAMQDARRARQQEAPQPGNSPSAQTPPARS